MGENEQSEMIHYTIFFILLMILSTLFFGFLQVSQVQTVQNNIENVLSKNGGYTQAAIQEITGSSTGNVNGNNEISIKNSNWVYLSKSAATNNDLWTKLNNGNPQTTSGDTNHWELAGNTTEQQNVLIPYQITVRPLGSGSNASNIVFGWIPEMKFSGVAQSQVYTEQVS
jgi:hypothetical protein